MSNCRPPSNVSKVFSVRSVTTSKEVSSEITIVTQLTHSNILLFYSVKDFTEDLKLSFVGFMTEWCEGAICLRRSTSFKPKRSKD